MRGKERVVFLDRAAFASEGELPVPGFDHNWSEYPATEAEDVVPRLFWATIAITHQCPLDAVRLTQLHKLAHVVVTGPAEVDAEACRAQGITVRHLPADEATGEGLVGLLEMLVEEGER